jgi:hypothetical protein
MKTFIYKTSFFIGLVALPTVLFYLTQKTYLAAKKVSPSYSYNEKLRWLPSPQKHKIISIGSSMALNNVHSKVITDSLQTDSYLNIGSWGLSVYDLKDLMPDLIQSYHPDTIIYVCNVMDFTNHRILSDNDFYVQLKDRKQTTLTDLVTSFYYWDRTFDNRINLTQNTVQTSLKFDDYGAVLLANKSFEINEANWNARLDLSKIDSSSYEMLSILAKDLRAKGIALILVQTPIRGDLLTPSFLTDLKSHTSRLEETADQHNQKFIDLSELRLDTDHFVDHSHLKEAGARVFTSSFVSSL